MTDEVKAEPDLIGGSVFSDAVYRFAGWLTCQPGTWTIGAGHDAAPMAEAVDKFLNVPRSNAFMERVIFEEAALSANLKKLGDFIGGDTFLKLADRVRDQLMRQEEAMISYREVLRERIADHQAGQSDG